MTGRPRNRWQDEVTRDGRLVGGTWWRERVHNRGEWKKLLRTAMNRRNLHMPLNEYENVALRGCYPELFTDVSG